MLYAIWTSLVLPPPSNAGELRDSMVQIEVKAKTRSRRVLEHLFRVHSAEVLESIIECWNRDEDSQVQSSAVPDLQHALIYTMQQPTAGVDAVFELVDILTANASHAVHMICEGITCRSGGVSEKIQKQAINPNL